MDDDMPPLASDADTKPIMVGKEELEEGEIAQPDFKTTQQSLVAYSSSPPSLVRDSSVLRLLDAQPVTDTEAMMASLRVQLELASHEYSELAEGHKKLTEQHGEIRTLCSTYNDVIQGYTSQEEQTASIEQLRTEAGREGLRAKALEADILRPIIREAGGLQALISLVQSVQPLVQQAGGLRELENLVSDAQLLRTSVDKVGGLQGLDNLITEADILRSQKQEYLDLRDRMDGLDEYASKAAKYDKLMQAFTEIQNTPIDVAQARPAPREASTAPVAPSGIHPSRAIHIASTPLQNDQDRDLYEAPRFDQSYNKTGSNDIPLGRLNGPDWGRLKRELSDAPPADVAKRPRVDVGRASALVQASLAGSWAPGRQWQAESDRFLENFAPPVPGPRVPSATEGFAGHSRSPMIKQEDIQYSPAQNAQVDDFPRALLGGSVVSNRHFGQTSTAAVGGYPIAFWIGSTKPKYPLSLDSLKSAEQMPWSVVEFLGNKLSKYMDDANVRLLNTMSSDADTCVLRYFRNNQRHSSDRDSWRVCGRCYPISREHSRPCVRLYRVRGVLTLVFMPLSDEMRCGVSWHKKEFWLRFAK